MCIINTIYTLQDLSENIFYEAWCLRDLVIPEAVTCIHEAHRFAFLGCSLLLLSDEAQCII
jgi:hypothetical protein